MNVEEMKQQNRINREKIIEAAIVCFVTHGIHNTSIGMIAQRCGLNYRTVTRNFESKENIVIAAMKEYIAHLADCLTEVLQNPAFLKRSGLDKTLYIAELVLNYGVTHYQSVLLINELEIFLCESGNEKAQELLRQHLDRIAFLESMMQQMVENGIQDGTIRQNLNREEAGELLTGVLKGLFQRLAVVCGSDETAEHVRPMGEIKLYLGIVRTFLEG